MKAEAYPVFKYSVQLYYSPVKDGKISYTEQIASGVLVRNSSNYFLLTCKHVFDGIKPEDVVILTTIIGLSVRLTNEITFIDKDNKSIDLALIRIRGENIKILKAFYTFLPSEKMGFDHVFDEKKQCLLLGFMNKRTNLRGEDFYSQSSTVFTTIRRYKKIEKMGFSYDNNITLEFNRKSFDLENKKEVKEMGTKDIKGLSGGGIWELVLRKGKRYGTLGYTLVGIMIEERQDRGGVSEPKLISLKMHFGKSNSGISEQFGYSHLYKTYLRQVSAFHSH